MGELGTRLRSWRVLRGVLLFAGATILLFVMDGSRQPTSGNGWRILGYQRGVAAPGDLVVITSQADLDATWDRMRIRTAPARLPADARTFWVTATGTIGCPAHFAGFRADSGSVTAIFTRALTSGCDNLKVPDSFLLAVDTGRLPTNVFRFVRQGPDGQPDLVVEIQP
jgi:hypothetical protein